MAKISANNNSKKCIYTHTKLKEEGKPATSINFNRKHMTHQNQMPVSELKCSNRRLCLSTLTLTLTPVLVNNVTIYKLL